MRDVFPDADFCIWKDFPFNQMIDVWINVNYFNHLRPSTLDLDPSCTFLFVSRYYDMERAKPLIVSCNFERRLRLCEKSEYEIKQLWGIYDTRMILKNLRMVINTSSFPICILGVITNSMLIHLIWNEKTKELFKNLKQYPYLGIISIINTIMLIIQILSWTSDCKDTFDVFCPSTRRFIPIQFFKV